MKKMLWNMLSNIKNAQKINKTIIFQKKTYLCKTFLNLLWNEGLILGFRDSNIINNYYEIFLKINFSIKNIKIVYKKRKHNFLTLDQLWKINYTYELLIIMTKKGFLTLENCKKNRIGGKPFLLIK